MTANSSASPYVWPGLLGRIDAALIKQGRNCAAPSLDDLAPVDEFHLRGPAATGALIALMAAGENMHILDAGCGLGGPARRLAQTTGCRVTGVDLNAEFCAVGNTLSARMGLDDRVVLHPGDATDLRMFPAASFDGAWSIHAAMNIADKAALYRAIGRVLKPGGKLVIYDVLSAAPDGGRVRYPTPWAGDSSESFLVDEPRLRALLCGAGFGVCTVEDHSAQALAALERGVHAPPGVSRAPALDLSLILGPVFQRARATMHFNLKERRVRLCLVVCHLSSCENGDRFVV
ncbi:SAM-dependent methyltransferase [Varunaivibrio sulfuroxidans]|uniref:Ubiquinone/menaquinone biosynthesis C-methylase UbiE n=1 Tax=Varunaivibrio sulfuroxidans TaxID=1773489 RepID=A0A4R3JHG6_9PROT|nr:class I SAM-dependent methyltransferase [Varunaivibrio sulfuroxidans]TCS64955.1 ubiquinone/menaquinone biosynthesis C-methylase UbiE [Varunaivibrio sulfuroxidans]WES29753.1 class I SAM-dependent methyltransferase [Varunaivibrio sulfuroxidans]